MTFGFRASSSVALLALAAAFAGCASKNEIAEGGEELTFRSTAQVSIDEPALGAFVTATEDGFVQVKGRAKGSAVSVNGQAVAVDGSGRFSGRVRATPGVNVISAKLHGGWGGLAQRAFLYGDFAKPAANLANGVQVRSNARAYDDGDADLDDYSSIGRALINSADLDKYLKQVPPTVYDFGFGSVDVAVTSMSFEKDKTDLHLSPKAVGAHLRGSFSKIVMKLRIVLHFGGDYETTATVAVDAAAFEGDVQARFSPTARIPDPGNPGSFIVGPGIEGKMDKPAIALGNLSVDLDLDFPGVDAFITWLANQSRGLIAEIVGAAIRDNAANHFATALNQLGLPTVFELKGYGIDASVRAAEEFDAGTAFDDAGVTISATAAVSWPKLEGGAPGNFAPGSFAVGAGPAREFPAASFSTSISFDLMNQAVFAVWGQGALARTVYEGKSYKYFKLDPVVATPRLPPVLVALGGGRVRLHLGDIDVKTMLHALWVDAPVEVMVSAFADVQLAVNPANGALRFTMIGEPKVSIDVNQVLGLVPDALLGPLSEVLQAIAPIVVANVVKPIEVPLPALPLSKVIPGRTEKLGLAPDATIAVDEKARRVMVSGELMVRP